MLSGDVATLDPDGYMQITDRSKDVIKSGGGPLSIQRAVIGMIDTEWISSIDLENEAIGHPAVVWHANKSLPFG